MGIRRATILFGCLLSVLTTFAPPQWGGLGLLAIGTGTGAYWPNGTGTGAYWPNGFTLPKRAEPEADLYLDFNPSTRRMIATSRGQVFFVCEARNDTVRPKQYGKWGHCPPGWYRVNAPVMTPGSVKFGPAFLGLFDTIGPETAGMKRWKRAGIGIHGGGTGLPSPLASRQGWRSTLGCIRMQNADLSSLVSLVNWVRGRGGECWIRVAANPLVR